MGVLISISNVHPRKRSRERRIYWRRYFWGIEINICWFTNENILDNASWAGSRRFSMQNNENQVWLIKREMAFWQEHRPENYRMYSWSRGCRWNTSVNVLGTRMEYHTDYKWALHHSQWRLGTNWIRSFLRGFYRLFLWDNSIQLRSRSNKRVHCILQCSRRAWKNPV